MTEGFTDHYEILGIEPTADADEIRRAFRVRLLEVHPDKSPEPEHPDLLRAVMNAFEVLGNTELREGYDRVFRLRHGIGPPGSAIPHVTESERPADRARAILFLLLEEKPEEALERLRAIDGEAAPFLAGHLEDGEFIDAAFLLAELFEGRRSYFEALEWYQEILGREGGRRRHRPCYAESLERTKRLLIHRMPAGLDPRVTLEYLRRAEALGLDRPRRAEVSKRRAQCYLAMGMKAEAARHFELAISLQPGLKGIQRLRQNLEGYLD